MANGPFANNKADGNYDIPKKPLKTPDAGNYINVTLKRKLTRSFL